MQLDTIRMSISQQIESAMSLSEYLATRSRHEVLKDLATPTAVVARLNRQGSQYYALRSAITKAVIAEAKATQAGVWASLLMLAYFPGLLKIRKSLKPSASYKTSDLSALLIESFYEAVHTFPLSTQGRLAAINLMLNTRKLAWRELRRDRERSLSEVELKDEQLLSPRSTSRSPERILIDRQTASLLDKEHVDAFIDSAFKGEKTDDVLMVIGTFSTSLPLIDWVRRQNPDLEPESFRREYARVRRRRSRLLERVRRRLASHKELRAALLYQDQRMGT